MSRGFLRRFVVRRGVDFTPWVVSTLDVGTASGRVADLDDVWGGWERDEGW